MHHEINCLAVGCQDFLQGEATAFVPTRVIQLDMDFLHVKITDSKYQDQQAMLHVTKLRRISSCSQILIVDKVP